MSRSTPTRRAAFLSMHSSPLARLGEGDGGGMSVYVLELASSLARAGIEVDVFTRDHGVADRIVKVEPGLRVVHVPAGPRGSLPKESMAAHIDEFADGVAAAVSESGADVLHANYWLSGLAGHRLKHDLDLPLVATFHTLARVKAEADVHEPAGRAEAEASIIGCSDAICVSCPDEAAQLVRLYDADPDRLEFVVPGVDHAFFSPGPRVGARKALGFGDEPIVLFVGRIQPLKGLDTAIETLALMDTPNARLVVVGGPSGPDGASEIAAVERRSAELGLQHRIEYVAPQPHHRLSTYYRAADVSFVPSRSESFGLVALEAAACGLPVVAAAVGGLTTLVVDGVTGHLVEGRDPYEFARRLDEVLADEAMATRMGAEASIRATGYTWSTSAARLRRLYADLATRAPVPCP